MKPWTYKSNISGDWHRCTIMLGDGSTVGGRMSLADARLIAQAPALLEALEEILSWDTLAPVEAVKNAQAVVKAARGEK